MRRRASSASGARARACGLAWANSPYCAVGARLPAPTHMGPQSPKSAEIAKIDPARKMVLLGRQDELEGPRWRF